MENLIELWQKVVTNLSMSAETYNLWISPLKPTSLEDDVLTIAVPNFYFSQWIEANQKEKMESLLTEIRGQRTALALQIHTDIITPNGQSNASFTSQTENIPQAQQNNQYQNGSPNSSANASGNGIAANQNSKQFSNRYTFDKFVVGASNRFAHGCCEAVAKMPGSQFNPLFIYGGVGLGKTHLLQAIGNYIFQNNPTARVLYVTSEKFTSDFIESLRSSTVLSFKEKYRNLDCLFIDDIQFLIGKEASQEEFFHIFNILFESRKQIVLTSDRPPKELEKVEERLISRFEWGVIADIQPPDLETRIAILRKKAEDEKMFIPDDVILYIATQIKSNIRELEGSLLRISAFSAVTNTTLTLDSVQTILRDIVKPVNYVRITMDKIKKVVAAEYNMDVKDMASKRRTDAIAFPRQIAMYLSRTMSDEYSTTEIGTSFGGRDHTTVMHACTKIKDKMSSDPYFNAKLNTIIKKIKESSSD
ncbi:MAG: chromosomal replication initiator protein DnaA [Elusimicrobiota bacterium]|jgi:chromosomal replication initiator protein|nr:chromosomal replication initiator protein DnaA [Elusimicrobiota bacterium]